MGRARANVSASTTASVVALALLLATVAARVSASEGTTLHDGVTMTADLIAATAASQSNVVFVLEPASADPARANDLRNHHSLSDHSDQQRFPGYNDCDAWRNLFDDGWSATSSVSAYITPDQAGALLADVRAGWQAQGYAVEEFTFGSGTRAASRLTIDLGFASVALDVNPQRGTARLSGTTDCLAPS